MRNADVKILGQTARRPVASGAHTKGNVPADETMRTAVPILNFMELPRDSRQESKIRHSQQKTES